MASHASRDRLDRALVLRGLADSREQAGRLILSGRVRVDNALADKPARLVSDEASITLLEKEPYASRAGKKLEAALDAFGVDPDGKIAMDIGASTGGFTDCLLQRGVQRVYAVDVGYGQLDWRLARDSRVVVLDRQNIRHLAPEAVSDPIDLAVVDVSFISLTLVLPAVLRFLAKPAAVIALIKPQFEVGRGQVGRGGVVREDSKRLGAAEKVVEHAKRIGLACMGTIDSPVSGQKGNREILAGFTFGGE